MFADRLFSLLWLENSPFVFHIWMGCRFSAKAPRIQVTTSIEVGQVRLIRNTVKHGTRTDSRRRFGTPTNTFGHQLQLVLQRICAAAPGGVRPVKIPAGTWGEPQVTRPGLLSHICEDGPLLNAKDCLTTFQIRLASSATLLCEGAMTIFWNHTKHPPFSCSHQLQDIAVFSPLRRSYVSPLDLSEATGKHGDIVNLGTYEGPAITAIVIVNFLAVL